MIRQACEKACFKFLLKEKNKISKGKEIHYAKLEMQPYLTSKSGISTDSMRRIYHIRCRELPVKANFPMMFKNDKKCFFPFCTNDDSQYHIYTSTCFSKSNEVIDKIYDYSDIFTNNISAQFRIERIFVQKLEERKKYMTLYDKEFPADPRTTASGIKKAMFKVKKKIGITIRHKHKHMEQNN